MYIQYTVCIGIRVDWVFCIEANETHIHVYVWFVSKRNLCTADLVCVQSIYVTCVRRRQWLSGRRRGRCNRRWEFGWCSLACYSTQCSSGLDSGCGWGTVGGGRRRQHPLNVSLLHNHENSGHVTFSMKSHVQMEKLVKNRVTATEEHHHIDI